MFYGSNSKITLFFFLQTAISALQSVLQEDFKATEIEVESVCVCVVKAQIPVYDTMFWVDLTQSLLLS